MTTTNITDLPTTEQKSENNISMEINNIPQQNSNTDIGHSNNSSQTNDMKELLDGINIASKTGATQLSSRDIPITTEYIMKDPEIKPNFIPQTGGQYISDMDENINIDYQNKDINSSDYIYDEIQIPLMLSVLYFLFQIPIIKTSLYKYLPSLCNVDGNYNLNGLFFISVLFGLVFFIMNKIKTYLSSI